MHQGAEMGGINPNRGPKPVYRRAQRVEQLLFRAIGAFFAAQAHLEDAVMADEDGLPDVARTSLLDARQTLENSADAVHAVVGLARTSIGVARAEQFDGVDAYVNWYADLEQQATRLAALVEGLLGDAPAGLLSATDGQGGLQRSMWTDGENSNVRNIGLDALDVIRRILQDLDRVVRATNE